MARNTAPTLVISHWYNLLEGLQASPKEFYTAVEEAIRKRQVPDVKWFRADFPEGGPLSPRREYLRVTRRDHVFDICGAPFGNGFFVSWWLGELPGGCLALLLAIPLLNLIVAPFVRMTYYKIDTALMFQECVRLSVLEVIDGMTSAKGLRALSDLERKPILKELFKR